MSDPNLYIALSFFCLAGAPLVFFVRSGRELKRNKRKLDEIGEGLAKFKPLENQAADTEDSNGSSRPR